MSNANVIPLHQDVMAVSGLHDDVPWMYAQVVSQANEALLVSEERFHKEAKGLVEGINQIDRTVAPLATEARTRETVWKAHDEQASHVPVVRAALCNALSAVIFAAELVLAATTFRGLGLDELEIYITAFGSVGVAFLLTKIIASGLRWQPHRHDEPGKKTQEAWMIGASAVFLLLMLVGMGLARITFSAAEAAASGNEGISNVALWGFAALQAGLYFAQIGVFYFLLPANPVAYLARTNYLAANRRLQAALQRRTAQATQLNYLSNRLRAERDRRVEDAKQMMVMYVGALHRLDKGALLHGLETCLRDDWFRPVASRIAAAVDAAPQDVQELVTGKA